MDYVDFDKKESALSGTISLKARPSRLSIVYCMLGCTYLFSKKSDVICLQAAASLLCFHFEMPQQLKQNSKVDPLLTALALLVKFQRQAHLMRYIEVEIWGMRLVNAVADYPRLPAHRAHNADLRPGYSQGK